MTERYPTKRPINTAEVTQEPSLPPELANVPWIDVHNHAHTLSWNDRERFALSGCHSMVMMAAGYYWTPYRPVEPADVRYLWDDALNRLPTINQSHVFDAKLAVGIHTGVRVDDYESLLDIMPAYCDLDEVVAVGEIGVTEAQQGSRWDLDGQRDVTRRQLEIAEDEDLPAVLHTPSDPDLDMSPRQRGRLPGYETAIETTQDPVIEADDVKRAAIDIDLELKNEAGLSDDRLVLSHANRSIASYVLEETDCYLSFTVSYPWLLGVGPRDVAAVVAEYGPDRVLVETDSAGVLQSDVFAYKRTIFEMYREGIDIEEIRQVVYENPRRLFG